jgi:molecular chaperone GrpE
MTEEQKTSQNEKSAEGAVEDNNEEKTPRDDQSSFVKTTEDSSVPQETELEKCSRERAEYLAGWQRAKADFLNYQKDERKRLEEFLKFCEAGLLGDLLPVLDSFDLALAQFGETSDPKFKGFFLIKSQIDEILKKRGLEPIKSAGEKFNPEFHEAVGTIEAEGESQTIVEEIQKGYKLNGKVLRPSKVKIIK